MSTQPADEPLIVSVIHRYCPDWQPPRDNGKTWIPTRCPFHGEERASAAVSYELDSFRCQACPARGNAVTIIMRQEEVPYREAQRIAEGVSTRGDNPVPRKPERKPSRRLFTGEGVVPDKRAGREVPAGVRRRASSWP